MRTIKTGETYHRRASNELTALESLLAVLAVALTVVGIGVTL